MALTFLDVVKRDSVERYIDHALLNAVEEGLAKEGIPARIVIPLKEEQAHYCRQARVDLRYRRLAWPYVKLLGTGMVFLTKWAGEETLAEAFMLEQAAGDSDPPEVCTCAEYTDFEIETAERLLGVGRIRRKEPVTGCGGTPTMYHYVLDL